MNYGSLDANTTLFLQNQPELFADVTLANQITWLSVVILIFFGISVYPQAIQRIYSAKNENTLRRSLSLMVIMPLLTTLPLVIIAIIGSAHFPDLDKAGSEQIILLMLNKLTHIEGMSIVITIFVAAAIAAIMSTVDSAMLAIASLFTQDIYHKQNPQASQKKLTYVGKVFSWGIMAFMVVLAVNLPSTIWWLIQMKLEILVHVAPAIMLGVHFKNISHKSIIYGLLAGVGVTLLFLLTPLPSKPFGFHAGVVGLFVNFISIYLHHMYKR